MKLDFNQCFVSFIFGAIIMGLFLAIAVDYFPDSNGPYTISHVCKPPEPRPPEVSVEYFYNAPQLSDIYRLGHF